MKRRKFILTAVAVTAIITVPVINYRCRDTLLYDPLISPDILARFCDKETICEIGTHYRAHVPEEDKKEKLVEIIMKDYYGQPTPESGKEKMSEWLEKKIVQDFKTNRMVIVDGWILSETEARQCALLSLV